MLSPASSLSLLLLSSLRCARPRHLLVPFTCGLQNQEVLNTDDSLDLWWLGGVLQHGRRFAPVRHALDLYGGTTDTLPGNTQAAVNYMLSVSYLISTAHDYNSCINRKLPSLT